MVYGEETAPRYEYDYNAKGQVARVRDNLLNRTTQSEYDLANRPVRVKTAEAGQHVYTGQVAYDNVYGNLSEFTEKVGENRQEYGTKFGYDDENRPTSLTYSVGAATIGQSTTTIDKLNRTTFSAVKLGSKTFTSEYHFAAGGYGTGSVTNLVASITQPGCNCGYGYDDNGNIASATLNGKWTGYTYDALGQLIQVNDHSDTRSGENGTTWKYTYDLGGNILKKERFAYADTTTPLETVTYTYGDANWRDKLTAVNGNAIAYDAIGNPLNDGTWTYTWQNGRQLQKMQKAGVTAEFVYNADGLRVQKTVNGVVTKYTLHGKNVVHMTSVTDELHFFYDAQNRPAVVVYNGVPYAYVKSLQGDVIAILDAAGNVVVSYMYDAWGMPIGKNGALSETLGTLNPFRYRGYVFDEETGLYYLRSRYYNAERSRFVNADSVLLQNLFSYCENSPINNLDTEGTTSSRLCEMSCYIENTSDPWKYYGVSPEVARAIDKIMENPEMYGYSIKVNGKYQYGIYKKKQVIRVCCASLLRGILGGGNSAGKRRASCPDLQELTDLNQLQPGMEIYQGTSHCGLVIMYDFGDGKGYRLAVFQSTSVANIATEAKTITTAVFMDDSNAGPNITALDEIGHWDAFGHPDYTKGSDAFMLDPNNKWYLYK